MRTLHTLKSTNQLVSDLLQKTIAVIKTEYGDDAEIIVNATYGEIQYRYFCRDVDNDEEDYWSEWESINPSYWPVWSSLFHENFDPSMINYIYK